MVGRRLWDYILTLELSWNSINRSHVGKLIDNVVFCEDFKRNKTVQGSLNLKEMCMHAAITINFYL